MSQKRVKSGLKEPLMQNNTNNNFSDFSKTSSSVFGATVGDMGSIDVADPESGTLLGAPRTLLSQTSTQPHYGFSSHLPFGVRHLYNLFISVLGLGLLFCFILPSFFFITCFGLLFRRLQSFRNTSRTSESSSSSLSTITLFYGDLRLWLLSHPAPSTGISVRRVLWHWLNYTTTLYLYCLYVAVRSQGSNNLYVLRKDLADHYGEFQPFAGGLTCTNYKRVSAMLHDPNGQKSFVFQTLPSRLIRIFMAHSPIMHSTNSAEHLRSRGMMTAFLAPVFETIKQFEREVEQMDALDALDASDTLDENDKDGIDVLLSDSNVPKHGTNEQKIDIGADDEKNKNSPSPLVEVFYELYLPRVDKLLSQIKKRIQCECEAVIRAKEENNNTQDKQSNENNENNEIDENDAKIVYNNENEHVAPKIVNLEEKEFEDVVESVLDEFQSRIQALLMRVALYFFFYDRADQTFINIEKSPLKSQDLDRLLDSIQAWNKVLLLPSIVYLPFAPLLVWFESNLASCLRDLRNLFAKHQQCASMRNWLHRVELDFLSTNSADTSDAPDVEDALYSLVSTLMVAALIGLDAPVVYGLKLFFKDFELYKEEMFDLGEDAQGRRQHRKLFVKEMVRVLGVLPGTNTMLLPRQETIQIRDKTYEFPAGTPVMLLLGRANRDANVFGLDRNEMNPSRRDLDRILSWNARERLIMQRNELAAPRMCPGHDLALFVVARVLLMFGRDESIFLQWDSSPRDGVKKVRKTHIRAVTKELDAFSRFYVTAMTPGTRARNMDKTYDNVPLALEVKDLEDIKDLKNVERDGMGLVKFEKSSMFGVDLIELDLYVGDLNPIKEAFISLTTDTTLYEMRDDPTLFDEDKKWARKLMKKFKKRKLEMPEPNVKWPGMHSDHEMSLFAFAGIGCHYTKCVGGGGIGDKVAGAAYYSDVTWLGDYEVRDGLERYGACAYFSRHCQLLGIYVTHLDSLVKVGLEEEDELEYAKYVWLTSVLLAVTLKDHALHNHLIEGNALVTCVYEMLPLDHWLRRLLTIFTYATVFINQNMQLILLPKNGYVHRLWGFTWNSLNEMAEDVIQSYEYVEYTKRFDAGLKQLDDAVFPLNKDSDEYYELTHRFVKRYFKSYENEIESDEHLKRFYNGLCNKLNINIEQGMKYSKDNLIELVANMICLVTAWHEQVGSIADNMCVELDWNDIKLYKKKKDKTCMARNDFVLTALLVMLTGYRNPSLLNDFSHVLLKDDKYDANKQTFDAWQEDLNFLMLRIEERNKNRRIEFNAVNPRYLECSVSV